MSSFPVVEESRWVRRRPGLAAGAVVESVVPGRLGEFDLVEAIGAVEAQIAHLRARQSELIAELSTRDQFAVCGRCDDEEVDNPIHSHDRVITTGQEIGPVLSLSPRQANEHAALAIDLIEEYHATFEALDTGRIGLAKAEVIVGALRGLVPALRADVEIELLGRAGSQTMRQLRRNAHKAVMAADPEAVSRRHAAGHRERRVEAPRLREDADGIADMILTGPAEDLAALYAAVDAAARAQRADRTPEDTRTLDQRRFDILTGLGWTALTLGHLGCCHPDCAATDDQPSTTGSDTPDSPDRAANRTADGDGTGVVDGTAPRAPAGDVQGPGSRTAGPREHSLTRSGPADGDPGRASGGREPGGPGSADGDPGRASGGREPGGPGSADGDPGRADLGTCSPVGLSDREPGGGDATGAAADHPGARPRPGAPSRPWRLGSRHRKPAAVEVTVAFSTLVGLDDHPAHLDDYGPIPAEVARRIAGDATLRRLLTDPVNGALLEYGRNTYTPPAALTDFVVARDRTCRFPTCDAPARACDIDHQHPWNAGGTTGATNTHALSRACHSAKTFHDWSVTTDPTDGSTRGDTIWTSPTGHVHRAPPETIGLIHPAPPPAGSAARAGSTPPDASTPAAGSSRHQAARPNLRSIVRAAIANPAPPDPHAPTPPF